MGVCYIYLSMVMIQKDQLAKLLATENVTVQHSVQANTASFDLKNRVLTLPILKYTDGDIVDILGSLRILLQVI